MLRMMIATLLMLLVLNTSSAATDKTEVTIYRDTWGVPHIYAETEAAGAYGLGYAQAEDRLADIYVSLRTGMGTMSEAFGEQFVEHDYTMQLCRNAELAEQTWDKLPKNLQIFLEHFAAGVQAYADEHPEDVPEYAMPIQPWMYRTVGRAMVLRWPLGTIADDLGNSGKRPRPPMRSNEWAVAPSRSADNIPILLSDPHLQWEGLAVMYEARLHAGDLHANGYFLIGAPLIGIGHNRHVGWALTTGGPDCGDVFEMKVRMNGQLEYEYDGKWRAAESKVFTIPVRGAEDVVRSAVYTHLGPIVSPIDLKSGKAYVGAAPMLGKTRLMEQSYRMAKAENVREFYEAVGMAEFNEQNIMFADVHGDIGYVRVGAAPIRPEGYHWDAPVPGHTSATAWQGLHPVDDLVHIFNPPQGYMQNCNISPEFMMVDSPLTADKYPDYLFNVSWDTNNPRSRRLVHLLDADDSVTREKAIAYATDVHDTLASRWQAELRLAVESVGEKQMKDAEFANAVQAILKWDGEFIPEATSTALYKFWRLKCGKEIDLSPIVGTDHFAKQQQQQMLSLLADTIKEMTTQYGRWDIAWGDIHKVGRGGQFFPVGGADFRSGNKEANFSETLFDVRSSADPDHPGHYIADNGSMAMILMFFHPEGIESLTCIPWGQSGHADSPHFMDQGEKLYSKRKMKSTWWKKEKLLAHVESEQVLQISPSKTKAAK